MGTNGRGPKLLFGALLLIIVIGALLNGAMMGPGMMGPGMMWGNGGTQPLASGWTWGLTMGFGMLMMLAFWVAVIVGVVLLIRWAMGGSSQAPAAAPPENPRDIVRRRYAAGEIDQETNQRMQRDREGDAGAAVERRSRQAVGTNGTERR
jgi:putative membrane protein